MPDAHFRLILDAKTEKNARTAFNRLGQFAGLTFVDMAPYGKGGFEVRANLKIPPGSWSEQVLAAISAAQTFGRGWVVTGTIEDSLELSTSEFVLPGLVFASFTLPNGSI